MKAGHWMAMIVALVIGVILGFGFGANPGKVAGLEKQIQQLTAENAQLKSQVATLSAPAVQAPAAAPPTTEPPKKQ
jgi:outer membrane murein-binding lipoprotein Lpp